MTELAAITVRTGDAALGSGVACHWSLTHETNSSSRPDGEADQRRKPGAAGKRIGPGTECRPYVGIVPQVQPSAAADGAAASDGDQPSELPLMWADSDVQGLVH